jgi:hypothetical protein
MGVYNTFQYADGTTYGQLSKIDYIAEPFSVTVLENEKAFGKIYPRVSLEWVSPAGVFLGFRIVRNQVHYAEHEEDGFVVYEYPNASGDELTTVFEDYRLSINLKTGKYAYYTIWILKDDYTWVIGAANHCLIPSEHGTYTPEGAVLRTSHEKFLDLIPRMYVSQGQSALDVPDLESDLSRFLEGFSFTLDEIFTFADLLLPDYSAANINPSILYAKTKELGIKNRAWYSMSTQQRLIREAIYTYQNKGTLNGIGTTIESITGLAPLIRVSPNVMLSPQDSSFYKGFGNWEPAAGATLELEDGVEVALTDIYAADLVYTGKVTTSTTNVTITNGFTEPRLNATPVTAEAEYSFRFNMQAESGSGTVTQSISWFDRLGEIIGSPVVGSTVTIGDTDWNLYEMVETAPVDAVYMGLSVKFSTAGTYYVDRFQVADTSDVRSEEFYEARGIEIYLKPSKINSIANPSFDYSSGDPTHGWTLDNFVATQVTLSSETEIQSTPSYSTVYGMNDPVAVSLTLDDTGLDAVLTYETPNTYVLPEDGFYTFSAYFNTDSTTPVHAYLSIEFYDSSIDESVESLTPFTPPVIVTNNKTSTWARGAVNFSIPQTFNAPTTAIRAHVYVVYDVSGEGNLGTNQLYVDGAQIELGYTATDYMDGSFSARGANWDGAINDSVSYQYRNRGRKIAALTADIPGIIPLNTAYIITSGSYANKNLEYYGFSS